jgi:hypothetical protein
VYGWKIYPYRFIARDQIDNRYYQKEIAMVSFTNNTLTFTYDRKLVIHDIKIGSQNDNLQIYNAILIKTTDEVSYAQSFTTPPTNFVIDYVTDYYLIQLYYENNKYQLNEY